MNRPPMYPSDRSRLFDKPDRVANSARLQVGPEPGFWKGVGYGLLFVAIGTLIIGGGAVLALRLTGVWKP